MSGAVAGPDARLSVRVVLTRPASDAAVWLEGLRAAGFTVHHLPLVAFGPAPDAAALDRARQAVAQVQAVWCVSPQAVHAFFEEKTALALLNKHFFASEFVSNVAGPASHGPRFWAPGPGTANALRACGVPANRIDQPPSHSAQFDSEALWPVVADQITPDAQVLVVRGFDASSSRETGRGREWLLDRIRQRGGKVWPVVAYERVRPVWSAEQCAFAQQSARDGSVWLFTSSDGVNALPHLLAQQNWGQAHALATHPRVAEAALAQGFKAVTVCRPTLADVQAALQQRVGCADRGRREVAASHQAPDGSVPPSLFSETPEPTMPRTP